MIIDTNGFEIGDEVWYVYKNCKYYVSCGRICKLIITQSYNDRTKLNIMVEFPYNAWDVPLSQLFHTEQQAIDHCNQMNKVE